MRRIYFVKYNDWSSTILGADQIAEALRARGYEAWSVSPDEVRDVRDAILVFIKTSHWWHLERARWRRNLTVLDVQDTVALKDRIKNPSLFDGMIWRSRRQLQDFGRAKQTNRVIPLQWDPRYLPNRIDGERFAIGYFGIARSFQHWGQIEGLPCYDRDYFRHAPDYNCHISVHPPGRNRLYKPGTKVSTAAACAANLITARDPSAIELLGDEYPYFLDSCELPGTLAGIEYARATFGGPKWRAGLERMREVRERTSIARVTDAYLDYFAELSR